MGILDGAGHGENIKAFVFARGLEELTTISHALGGLPYIVWCFRHW
jgi:glycerol-3-phosphate dehydrogenase